MMSRRPFFTAVSLIAIAGMAAFLAPRGGEFPDDYYYAVEGKSEKLRAMEGKEPPKLTLSSWIGDEQDLAKLKGKVVVVDFWATWCGPCVRAIPHNVELFTEHEDDGLMIIGVHDAKNGSAKMAEVARKQKINYPLAVDVDGDSEKAWNIGFWPSYFVIDRNGIVRAAGLKPDSVEKVVEKLLKEEAKG